MKKTKRLIQIFKIAKDYNLKPISISAYKL